MTTSNMSPDWIKRVIELNPCQELEGDNVRTCPVRIGFPHLDKPQKAMEAGKTDKYAVTCIFQPGSDITLLKTVAARVGQAKWGDQFMTYAQAPNFHNPFQDQAAKAQYEGFTAGLPCITATAERKPGVFLQNMSAPERTYPGQWAFVIVRPFAFETRNSNNVVLKRGLSFGLQSVMIIADDTEFGGGGVDPTQAFAGVNIDANVNPSAAFNATAGAAEPTPADIFR